MCNAILNVSCCNCFFFTVSPEEVQIHFFLDASSEDILEVEESNKTRPWLFTFFFWRETMSHTGRITEILARGRAH